MCKIMKHGRKQRADQRRLTTHLSYCSYSTLMMSSRTDRRKSYSPSVAGSARWSRRARLESVQQGGQAGRWVRLAGRPGMARCRVGRQSMHRQDGE